jgi:Mannosylglycerate hydrolase MGH1-like glycoside hydrolase domain
MRGTLLGAICLGLTASTAYAQTAQLPARSPQYARIQAGLQRGWNTWNTNTATSEVLLPQGLEIRVGFKQNSTLNSTAFLPTALIGRQGKNDEQVLPGPHAYDGSYSELKIIWHGYQVELQAAHAGSDAVMLATPVSGPKASSLPATIVFSAGFLWNQPGTVARESGRIVAAMPGQILPIYLAGKETADPNVPIAGPYFAAILDKPVGISTGAPRTLAEIQAALARQRQAYLQSIGGTAQNATVREAIEDVIAWDTIYEPEGHRVISPVSRIWNIGWGGYVLFDWDTFFAASLAAVDNRDLAYANVMEILNEVTSEGFVPNYARAGGWKSGDRSEPPVGAITVLQLYEQFHDRWLLEETFSRLLRWNLWWSEHRDMDGYLTWGSDRDGQPIDVDDPSRGTMQGARFESGLDNSPMYDTPIYDVATHQMEMADVGLMSLYIADSDALATIADVLEKTAEAKELRERAAKYRQSLSSLWDPQSGIYLNKDLHTGQFSHRLSPTNFYPLLAKAPSPAQAEQIIRKHLLNPDEFWGERVLPSISRNDPAFKDQDYWRGRIWGPMNYLVYLGLLKYDQPIAVEARRQLASKSLDLFLHEWREKGHVHENYSATSDDSDTVSNSDRFYHWGALLGLIGYDEATQDRSLKGK